MQTVFTDTLKWLENNETNRCFAVITTEIWRIIRRSLPDSRKTQKAEETQEAQEIQGLWNLQEILQLMTAVAQKRKQNPDQLGGIRGLRKYLE